MSLDREKKIAFVQSVHHRPKVKNSGAYYTPRGIIELDYKIYIDIEIILFKYVNSE